MIFFFEKKKCENLLFLSISFYFFLCFCFAEKDKVRVCAEYEIADVDVSKPEMLSFIRSQRGAPFLVQSGFVYRCERRRKQRTYWLCTKYKTVKCGGRLICDGNDVVKLTPHNHPIDFNRVDRSVIEYKNMTSPTIDLFLNNFKK